MKGVLLAGGTGSRLWPITRGISKQLLPLYDKPMIYYPVTTLISAGVREIALVTTREYMPAFQALLGDGKKWGLHFEYVVQDEPKGIADALLKASAFIAGDSVCLVLGDNFFNGFEAVVEPFETQGGFGAKVYGYEVSNPSDYGVVDLSTDGRPLRIVEKPANPTSRLAIPGIYFLDETACARASLLVPSARGELEIADLLQAYLQEKLLSVELPPRGSVWLDTGNFDALSEAGEYVRVVQNREGRKLGSPEEAAWRMGWISDQQLLELAQELIKSGYGKYLIGLLQGAK